MTQGYSVFSTLTHVGIPWFQWRGMANFQLKKKQLAIEQFKIAYEHNPYNIQTLNGVGIAYGLEGNYLKAREYFEQAVAICPEYENAMTNLAKVTR